MVGVRALVLMGQNYQTHRINLLALGKAPPYLPLARPSTLARWFECVQSACSRVREGDLHEHRFERHVP